MHLARANQVVTLERDPVSGELSDPDTDGTVVDFLEAAPGPQERVCRIVVSADDRQVYRCA